MAKDMQNKGSVVQNLYPWVVDREAEGYFFVNRELFTSPTLFELEMERIFESTWVFLGLESQIAEKNAYLSTYIGRQPVLLIRTENDEIKCFYNSCPHRGTLLTPFLKGKQKYLTCRYHGWVFDSSGNNVLITGKDAGNYHKSFFALSHDLKPISRLEIYRGFIFGSLAEDVPVLEEHLGEARVFLDLIADQAPNGLEFIDGAIDYTFDGNWKFQFENGLDFYHFAATHSSYVDILNQRTKKGRQSSPPSGFIYAEEEDTSQGTFSFPRGHSVMWSIRPGQEIRAINYDENLRQNIQKNIDKNKTKWMSRQRNLTIFPNLQIIDIQSLQLRTWRPLFVDKTKMTSHCLAPVGEGVEARRFRIRQYEEFFNASGLATSDDNAMYELCQRGAAALNSGFTLGYLRGMTGKNDTSKKFSLELGLNSAIHKYGTLEFGDETCFHAGYREWLRLMNKD